MISCRFKTAVSDLLWLYGPCPASFIARQLETTVQKARGTLHALEGEGVAAPSGRFDSEAFWKLARPYCDGTVQGRAVLLLWDRAEPMCACDIAEAVGSSPGYASDALRKAMKRGVVRRGYVGTRPCYWARGRCPALPENPEPVSRVRGPSVSDRVLECLRRSPAALDAKGIAEAEGLNFHSVRAYTRRLAEQGRIVEVTGRERLKIYTLPGKEARPSAECLALSGYAPYMSPSGVVVRSDSDSARIMASLERSPKTYPELMRDVGGHVSQYVARLCDWGLVTHTGESGSYVYAVAEEARL